MAIGIQNILRGNIKTVTFRALDHHLPHMVHFYFFSQFTGILGESIEVLFPTRAGNSRTNDDFHHIIQSYTRHQERSKCALVHFSSIKTYKYGSAILVRMEQKKILLIEDSKPLRTVLTERLREVGFEVTEANGGEEGLKLALEQKPDMIITDIVMFPVDGLELAKRVRESGNWGNDVHIVALTNQDSTQEKSRIEPLHLSAYFIKTDTPLDEIVKDVQKLFKGKKR